MLNPSPIAREYLQRGRSEACPIIDMHGHWGPFMGGYQPAADEDRMIHGLRRAGVERIVCSSPEALLGDFERGNREMQAVVDRYPDLISGYWSINPFYERSWRTAGADYETTHGFVGFKFLPDYHTYPLDGDHFKPALEYADSRRLLVLVHTWGGSPYDSPQLLEKVAIRHPNASFLMGHSGYGDWETSIRVARELPNVFLELTAVYAAHDFAMFPAGSGTPLPLGSCLHVNGIIEVMCEQAGAEKIVFGTDLPWYSPHYAAGAVLFAHINDDARHAILHRNAGRLLSG